MLEELTLGLRAEEVGPGPLNNGRCGMRVCFP